MSDASLDTPDRLADDTQILALREQGDAHVASASGAQASHRSFGGGAPHGSAAAAPVDAPVRPCSRTPSRRRVAVEFLRYFVGSGGALAVDVGLYQLALHLGLPYAMAALVGFCAGAVVAYVLSVKWVFETRAVRSAGIEFGLFVAVGAAGLLLTEALLWLQIGQFGLPALWSKIGAAGVVFVFNFVVRKTMLFSTHAR